VVRLFAKADQASGSVAPNGSGAERFTSSSAPQAISSRKCSIATGELAAMSFGVKMSPAVQYRLENSPIFARAPPQERRPLPTIVHQSRIGRRIGAGARAIQGCARLDFCLRGIVFIIEFLDHFLSGLRVIGSETAVRLRHYAGPSRGRATPPKISRATMTAPRRAAIAIA
jgi:hypothetical protein